MAPKLPPETAFWMGHIPTLEELAEEYGADACYYSEDLKSILPSNRDVHTLPSLSPRLTELLGVPCASGAENGSKGSTRVLDSLLGNVLNRCRSLKTDAEVACSFQANVISGRAHMDMWRDCRPGMYEYQLEATFNSSTLKGGAFQLGYPSIVMKEDLILVDAGAEIRNYTADISRTFPASGTFEGIRKDVFAAVLESQEKALSLMKAGADMPTIDQECRKVLLAHLKDNMGLVTGSIDELIAAKVDRVFMPHGLSHFLGLDVHDVSDVGPVPKKLKPGHLVTVEPGLYFIDQLIRKAAADPKQASLINFDKVEKVGDIGGVRIEDNVLIEEEGIFNLTVEAGCVKSIKDVEEVMQHGREARVN
eukprot:gene13190-19023_t